jgi:AsmA protein
MKRIAVVAVIAVGLAGIAALAVPLLVSPNLIKQRIAERISAATGRAVTLSGEPNLSIYPHLAVTIDGLTVANPQGMGDDPFVVADEVTTRLRLLPLLTGRIELDAFELLRPRVHLIAEADGRTNWQLAGDAADGGPAIANLALGRLQIADGTIIYDSLADKHHEELSAVALDINWASAASAASGNGKLQWRGEVFEFNGSVASPVDLFGGKESVVHFAVASTPVRISFNGKALGIDGADLEGDTALSTPSLRKVVAWLGAPLGNGSILGPASIEGRLSWHGAALSFSKATFSLDGNDAQGVASIDFGAARPAVQGTFAAAKLDLSPYFEAVRADLSANGPWPFTATRLPIADLADCDLRLSASDALIGSVRLTGFGATGTIKDGMVTVNIGEAQVYGGKLGATITARMDGNRFVSRVKATIDGALAQAPLHDLLDIGALSGKANASIDIAGSGATWGELAHSVTGEATIAIADGTLSGIDTKEIAARMVDPLAEPMPPGDGVASFITLSGTVAIANSILSTGGLALEGADYAVALNGRGSLLTGSVEANATLATKGGAGRTIPLTVSGTWRAPLIGPRQLTLKGDAASLPPG